MTCKEWSKSQAISKLCRKFILPSVQRATLSSSLQCSDILLKYASMAAKDLDIAQQLDAALIGSVKVCQLDQLYFESPDESGSRSINQGHIQRLLHRFNNEGCRRFDPLTWITAEVSPFDLEQLMMNNSVGGLTKDNPTELKLQPGFMVHCFQGRHRLAAATIWLNPNEQWWNLILYDSTKLTAETRRKLREAERVSQEFSDGDIYRNVRYYQQRGDIEPAGEWLARWTPTKCRDFKEIYEPKVDNHHDFRKNLDALLRFPALWSPWLMGTHLLSLKCPEELADYLGHVHCAWTLLTCHRPDLLDSETVGLLEGRCPHLSEADRWHIENVFSQGQVFRCVTDSGLRLQMQQAALDYPAIIPSLKIFLENTKYLKPIVHVVKKLLPHNFKGTVRQTMRRFYVAPQNQKFPIQVSENKLEEHEHSNQNYGFWSAYNQIFLFAMRHFYGLSEARPLGHSRYTMSKKPQDHQILWSRFKSLAQSVGFLLPGHQLSSRPAQNPPETTAIYTFLTRLRPPGLFEHNPSILAECSSHIAKTLSQIKECRVETPVPSLSLDMVDDWSLQKRCGMTDIGTFFSDQKYLFFHNIYHPPNDLRRQQLTSYAVKRDIFLAFFPGFREDIDMTGVDHLPAENQQVQAEPGLTQENTSSTPPIQDIDMVPEEEADMPGSSLATALIPLISQSQPTSGLETRFQPSANSHFDAPTGFPTGSELNLARQTHAGHLLEPSNQLALQSSAEHDLGPISWQTVDACVCHINIPPSLFYTRLHEQVPENPPYTILFHVSEEMIICLLHSSVHNYSHIFQRYGITWFAKPNEGLGKPPMLNTLTLSQVMEILQQGVAFLVVGREKGFRSDILIDKHIVGAEQTIAMPHFNKSKNLWEMKPQDIIL